MSNTIEVIGEDELAARVEMYRDPGAQAREVLVDGSGLLAYAAASFPGASTSEIYAQFNEREAEGRGAHFDVYQGFTEEDYPWISIFNVVGTSAVKTAVLPPNLATAYFELHPKPTDDAFEARRHFSAITLGADSVAVATGELRPDRGLVLPQQADGPHIVHDIVPKNQDAAGNYVKLAVPNDDDETRERMEQGNYKPLDKLVTEMMSTAKSGTPVRRLSTPAATMRTRSVAPRRRSCNLD